MSLKQASGESVRIFTWKGCLHHPGLWVAQFGVTGNRVRPAGRKRWWSFLKINPSSTLVLKRISNKRDTHEIETEQGASLLYHLGIGALFGGIGRWSARDRLGSWPDSGVVCHTGHSYAPRERATAATGWLDGTRDDATGGKFRVSQGPASSDSPAAPAGLNVGGCPASDLGPQILQLLPDALAEEDVSGSQGPARARVEVALELLGVLEYELGVLDSLLFAATKLLERRD